MHPADIQARLKKRGITQKMIADELEVTPQHISGLILHPKARPSDRAFKTIARKIGKDHREVFPSVYIKKTKKIQGL